MFRTPCAAKIQAIRLPLGEATRSVGKGALITCSSVNDPSARPAPCARNKPLHRKRPHTGRKLLRISVLLQVLNSLGCYDDSRLVTIQSNAVRSLPPVEQPEALPASRSTEPPGYRWLTGVCLSRSQTNESANPTHVKIESCPLLQQCSRRCPGGVAELRSYPRLS